MSWIQVLSVPLIGLRHKAQRWEANLRVGQFWMPNTFLRSYFNSKLISLVIRLKRSFLGQCIINIIFGAGRNNSTNSILYTSSLTIIFVGSGRVLVQTLSPSID